MLKISFLEGEYNGDLAALTRICEIEASVVPEGRAPYAPLEEALRVLEIFEERYSTPRPAGTRFTVFVGRSRGIDVEPLARLDVYAKDGTACASVVGTGPRYDTEPVYCAPDDDVVTIVRKILEGNPRDGTTA